MNIELSLTGCVQEGEDPNAKLTGAGRELKNAALLLEKKAKRYKSKQGKYITNHTGRHTRRRDKGLRETRT